MEANIVAYDVSLTSCGVAIRSEGQRYTVARQFPLSKFTPQKRADMLVTNVIEDIEEYRPSLILIEDYPYGIMKNGLPGLLSRAEVVGAMKYHITRSGIDILLVNVSAVKKYVTGKGRLENKSEVGIAIKQDFGIEFTTDDEADAFAMLLLGERSLSIVDTQPATSEAIRDDLISKCTRITGLHI